MKSGKRIESVDLARGVAALIMIQGHAYDGWVAPEYRESLGYAFTRLLGTLPLPAFLVLSGAAIALRLRAAEQRGQAAGEVRGRLLRRGLEVVAWGYAASFVYALMDGGMRPEIVLRADVLHAIGLSIAVVGAVCLWPGRMPRVWRMLALIVLVSVACPVLVPYTRELSGPGAYAVALFSDVGSITRMPVVPLVAWTATGVMAVQYLVPKEGGDAPAGRLLRLAVFGLLLACGGWLLTQGMLSALGGELSRAHWAVVPNVLDLSGRGLFVLGAGALVASRLPDSLRAHLVRIGRLSLVTYVFHIPFCYGVAAGPLRQSLDLASATLWVFVLMAMSYGAVLAVVGVRAVYESRKAAAAA